MKTRRQPSSQPAPSGELAALRARLAEADETLRAIGSGEVDTVVVAGKEGRRVFTLEGAEHAYRVLIESMNEGALTLTADETILYANQCFARLVQCPLEQVIGGSFRRFLSVEDRTALRSLMKRAASSGSKLQVMLKRGDKALIPAQISLRPLAREGLNRAAISLVVTDMTDARRTEDLLRALTHRVVQAQESERGRVALELHDHITQLLCAIVFRSQALVEMLAAQAGPAQDEAAQLHGMVGHAADEVERISRNLRPGVLEELGLDAVLHETCTAFAKRTGIKVSLTGLAQPDRLPADIELALYRILQEALKNVERHARARHVTVALSQPGSSVHLTITDDGVGFNPDRRPRARKGKGGLGLLGVRERATYVNGTLTVRTRRRTGTEVEVRIPLPPK